MIDRDSMVPMYHQVKGDIAEMIRTGRFQLGDRVYSENEICEKYNVSGITAKRVLNELAKEGFIERHPGKGSFVTQRHPISHVIKGLYSFTDEMKRQGMVPSNRIVELSLVLPPSECTDFFGWKATEQALYIQRLRMADDHVIALDHSFFPAETASWFSKDILEKKAVYEVLRENGLVPDKAVETFDAAALDAKAAELLEMEEGRPVLQVNRLAYSNGKPLEYNFRYYKSKQYLYKIELSL